MKLSLNEKQTLYHELSRFAQSGITMPQAVESLATDSRGALGWAFGRLSKLFGGGESVAGAFAGLRPAVGSMEVALIEASDRSGRLEQAFRYLADYFGTLDQVRAGIVKQAVWPVIQFHLAAVVLSFVSTYVLATFTGGGEFNARSFLTQVVVTLGGFYAVAAVLIGGSTLLVQAGRTNTGVDAFLATLPVVGRLRRNLALSRFCATYEMQLGAGVSHMDSVRAAGEASGGARFRAEAARMVPEMLRGRSLGTLLPGRTVFPSAFRRSIRTAEDTGTLDADLRRWSDYYQKASVDLLQAAGAWLSRVVSVTILVYVGYKIVTTYSLILNTEVNSALGE